MKLTPVEITCPGACSYTQILHLPTRQVDRILDDVDEDDTAEVLLEELFQGFADCPHDDVMYDVELGEEIERPLAEVFTGP